MLAACGPAVEVPDTDGSTTTRATTTRATATATSSAEPNATPSTSVPSPDPGSTATTTAFDTSSRTSFATSTSTTGNDPGSVCDPQPGSTYARIEIDVPRYPDSGVLLVEDVCLVDDILTIRDEQELHLSCPNAEAGPTFFIRVQSDPYVDLTMTLSIGQSVELHAARNYPIDYGGYMFVALREVEGDLIAGQYGWGNPPDSVDPAPWFTPLSFEPIDGLCEVDEWEEPRSFIDDPCPADQRRMALDFRVDGSTTRIYDGNRNLVGPYDIDVGSARRIMPVPGECTRVEHVSITWTAFPAD